MNAAVAAAAVADEAAAQPNARPVEPQPPQHLPVNGPQPSPRPIVNVVPASPSSPRNNNVPVASASSSSSNTSPTTNSTASATTGSTADVAAAAAAGDSIVEMNNSNSVLHKIANLYAEQLMSDICLVVGANRYPAHRVILCASSEVFQVMLMNPEWTECRESVIELKEEPCCSDVFPQFLKYLYVGQIRVSLQTVMPMLALADKYNIRDLVQLCVDYMLKHISKAATQGYLVSWLHYTISFSPYHQEVTDALQRFLKWNLDIVAESRDFVELDVNIVIVLLQQNDLVLRNEFELFGYVERWLLARIAQLSAAASSAATSASSEGAGPQLMAAASSADTDDEKLLAKRQLIESVVVHVRFAMMTPNELAKLLLKPIIKHHTEFFVECISMGMSYHSGQEERVQEVRAAHALQFTPRLYTSDTYSLGMVIPNFDKIENYQTFGACFFSQSTLSEYQEGKCGR